MDRSLTADDHRILERLNRALAAPAAAAPPALSELPGWFRALVAEQAAWLGIPVPGEAASGAFQAEGVQVPEAA